LSSVMAFHIKLARCVAAQMDFRRDWFQITST
jgi:hypothetical protein